MHTGYMFPVPHYCKCDDKLAHIAKIVTCERTAACAVCLGWYNLWSFEPHANNANYPDL